MNSNNFFDSNAGVHKKHSSKVNYYGVFRGRRSGVFLNWDDAKAQIEGVSGSKVKKFIRKEDAERFSRDGIYGCEKEANLKQLFTFPEDIPDTIHVWTDGSAGVEKITEKIAEGESNEETPKFIETAGSGAFFPHNPELNIAVPSVAPFTSPSAELNAVREALLQVFKHRKTIFKHKKHLILHTDCQYAIDSLTKNIYRWLKCDWKTVQGENVQNRELIYETWKLLQQEETAAEERLQIEFEWCKGHRGIHENCEADKLANLGRMKCLQQRAPNSSSV